MNAFRIRTALSIVCVLSFGSIVLSAEVKLYVAPNGQGGWSGATVAPTADGKDGPLASIAAARDAIRAHRAKGEWQKEAITVSIAAGNYFLTEPLDLDPQDGGSEKAPVVYQASEPGKTVLSGGQRITGWKPATLNGHKVWAAQIPDAAGGKWAPRQLFAKGERRPRTRLPKEGYYTLTGLPTARPETSWGEGQDQATFKPGDLKSWKNLGDIDVVALSLWIESHLPLATVDEATHTVKFAKKSVFRLTNGHAPGDFSRYYVENVMEALDTPGQWYLERSSGTLYYYPKPGEQPDTTEVIAARQPYLLKVAGKADGSQPISDVQLKGLTFAHVDWQLPADLAGWSQAAVGVPGAVQFQRAVRCAMDNCTIAHVSTYALEFLAGCEGNTISNCTLSDLGGGGVKIGHDTSHTTLTNCEIGPGGHIFHAAVGVWIGNSGNNTVTHNEIHDFYYTGVSVGWTWGYGPSKASFNKVDFNHIHDIGKGMLADMGGIYTLGPSPGTTLRYNRIHDISAHGYGGWGLYNDEGTTGMLLENNIVYRTTHGGYHQHYGEHNLVRNNIFAFGNPEVGQIIRSREEDHISFFFEHNIVYYDGGYLFGSTWKNGNWRLDYNDYWDISGKSATPAKDTTWQQWQEKGQDIHSIVADPGFADPKTGDFTLKADSPALKVGFKPIDASQIGIQRPSGRASAR